MIKKKSRVSSTIDGEFIMQDLKSTGLRSRPMFHPEVYPTFEEAYKRALSISEWDFDLVEVAIYPENIQKIVDKVKNERYALLDERERAKEFDEYQRLKKLFEGEDDTNITRTRN